MIAAFKVFLLLFLLSPLLSAQSKIVVENITVSEGLQNNNINDILQDHQGFVWLADKKGLQKFDGYTFTSLTPDTSDPAWQEALGLYEDSHKNLWIQMKKGLVRYHREANDFIKYLFINGNNDTIPYSVSAISEDMEGSLYVWIRDRGLYKIDQRKRNFIPNVKINEWCRRISKHAVLKETKRKGIYEIGITFPAGLYGTKTGYKFAIKRADGSLEMETNVNPAHPHGNRELFLYGDTLVLPVTSFNSPMRVKQEQIKAAHGSGTKSTYIKFSLDLKNLKNPLGEKDEIQVRGDFPPLFWAENFSAENMIFDTTNTLWVAMNYYPGLYRINPESGDVEKYYSNPQVAGSISHNYSNILSRDSEGRIWIGSNSGLNSYDSKKNSFENYFIDGTDKWDPINHIDKMTDDGYGNIWTIAHSEKGFGHFNKKSKKFIYNPEVSEMWFSSVTAARSGVVWLGQFYNGITKFNSRAKKFSTFSIDDEGKDVLKGKTIVAVYEDRDGDIWIGGILDGLYRYNRKTAKSTIYKADNTNPDKLISNNVLEIFQDSNGIIWIGTADGLQHFDPMTSRFKLLNPDPKSYWGLKRVHKIIEDKNGFLWMVSRNGLLVQLNPETFEAEFYSFYDNKIDRQIEYIDLVTDPRGFLWVATFNWGLLKFDMHLKKFSAEENIGKINLTSLLLDKEGILWCASNGHGLIRYNIKENIITRIREKDGLLSNGIMGIEQDHSGNLWLSSHKGLCSYNPETGLIKQYFDEENFLSNMFTYRAYHKTQKGEMVFGTDHGIMSFYPDSIKDNPFIPPVVFTGYQIDNKPVQFDSSISAKHHIILTQDQKIFSFEYAALNFISAQKNLYRYKMEGFDPNWIEAGTRRYATYTNLAAGDYTFRVLGSNNDGIWNEQGASVKITILPPWWNSYWAYALYFLLLVLTIYAWRRYELRRIYLRNELQQKDFQTQKLKEVDVLKSRFFANISHEFRTPLTLILGPLQKLLSSTGNQKSRDSILIMQRNANRLQQLIDQLLDLSKLDAQRMPLRVKPVNIVQKIKELMAAFSSLADTRSINLNFKSSDESIITYFDTDKLEKIIYNLLGNAFKFTPDGAKIEVGIMCRGRATSNSTAFDNYAVPDALPLPDTVSITISDTGPGIPAEQLNHIFDRFYQAEEGRKSAHVGSGIGLALSKELVELQHGEIRVESMLGEGTTFTVTLPLGRDHLKDEEIIVETEDVNVSSFISPDVFRAEDPPAVEIDDISKSNSGKPLVLIVDDNNDMRRYIYDSLSGHYNLLQAGNGEEGFETAIDKLPDIIVSDVMMPGMDGFEFCTQIKTDERTSHVPVILLTAKASVESKIEGLVTGADDYLTKPFDKRELLARIKNLIELRRKLQEKFRKDIIVRPGEITATSIDEKLLQKALNAVEKNISDPDFDTSALSKEVAVSRMLLHTKLKALTGQTTAEFIRTLRLKRAAQLLEQRSGNVSEIAYEVGFNNLSYFAKTFRAEFGKTPSQFISG